MSEKTYPIRLRQDWVNAYTGFDGPSQIPFNLTEDIAKNFLVSAACYIQFLKSDGIKFYEGISKAATQDRELFKKFSNFGHGQLHMLAQQLVDYIQRDTNQGNKALKRQGLEIKFPFSPESTINLVNYIDTHTALSFIGFLKDWTKNTKPQYTQTALLHIGDGLNWVKNSCPGQLGNINPLIGAYVRSGLAKAVNDIRALIPQEQPEEFDRRLAYQTATSSAVDCKDYDLVSTLRLD